MTFLVSFYSIFLHSDTPPSPEKWQPVCCVDITTILFHCNGYPEWSLSELMVSLPLVFELFPLLFGVGFGVHRL